MDRILSFIILIASGVIAEPPVPSISYGPPSSFSSFNRNHDTASFQSFRNSLPSSGGIRGTDPAQLGASIPGPKIFRHISLFVAPQDDEPQQQVRTIRPQQNPDKHVQIIFVKAPSSSNAQRTEIELPAQPEQKTLVYVLLKKPESGDNNIKIRGPRPTKPPAPDVYFIRYKDDSGNSQIGAISGQGPLGNNAGSLFAPIRSAGLSTSYGVP